MLSKQDPLGAIAMIGPAIQIVDSIYFLGLTPAFMSKVETFNLPTHKHLNSFPKSASGESLVPKTKEICE